MNNINFINYFKACLKKCFLFLFIFFIGNIDSRAEENIWFHSNGNYQSQKYSDLNQINQSNVKSLKLNWTYRNGYVPQGRNNNQSIPIYTGNSLIVTSLDNYLIALDPANGKEKWRTKLDSPVGKRGITYLKIKNENIIFVPTSKGMKAINETNGSIFNMIGKNGTFGNSLSLLPPIIDGNNIYVDNLKKIRAFNSKNVNELWSAELPVAGSSAPITYSHNRKQYLIINSTGGRFFGFSEAMGDIILAFAIN